MNKLVEGEAFIDSAIVIKSAKSKDNSLFKVFATFCISLIAILLFALVGEEVRLETSSTLSLHSRNLTLKEFCFVFFLFCFVVVVYFSLAEEWEKGSIYPENFLP